VATEYQVSRRLPAAPTFELKRFAWATPDRLELLGTFGGLQEAPVDASPVLVVRAGQSVHRLPADADSLAGPPQEDREWEATFAWQDAPVAFDGAEVHLGGGLVVQLPEPSAEQLLSRTRVLQVQSAQGDERQPPNGRAAAVGSQVEVLAAQEEVREVQVAMERTEAELSRARDDLQAERERRAGDSERFRDGLAKVREASEQALADAHKTMDARNVAAEKALGEANEAIEAKDAALETLRAQLEAAAAAKAKARGEAETQRERAAKLESDAKETGRLRTELEQAYGSVEQARGDAERILALLTAIRAK
jgi:hypothetical protein